jgi:hypothetical protein
MEIPTAVGLRLHPRGSNAALDLSLMEEHIDLPRVAEVAGMRMARVEIPFLIVEIGV